MPRNNKSTPNRRFKPGVGVKPPQREVEERLAGERNAIQLHTVWRTPESEKLAAQHTQDPFVGTDALNKLRQEGFTEFHLVDHIPLAPEGLLLTAYRPDGSVRLVAIATKRPDGKQAAESIDLVTLPLMGHLVEKLMRNAQEKPANAPIAPHEPVWPVIEAAETGLDQRYFLGYLHAAPATATTLGMHEVKGTPAPVTYVRGEGMPWHRNGSISRRDATMPLSIKGNGKVAATLRLPTGEHTSHEIVFSGLLIQEKLGRAQVRLPVDDMPQDPAQAKAIAGELAGYVNEVVTREDAHGAKYHLLGTSNNDVIGWGRTFGLKKVTANLKEAVRRLEPTPEQNRANLEGNAIREANLEFVISETGWKDNYRLFRNLDPSKPGAISITPEETTFNGIRNAIGTRKFSNVPLPVNLPVMDVPQDRNEAGRLGDRITQLVVRQIRDGTFDTELLQKPLKPNDLVRELSAKREGGANMGFVGKQLEGPGTSGEVDMAQNGKLSYRLKEFVTPGRRNVLGIEFRFTNHSPRFGTGGTRMITQFPFNEIPNPQSVEQAVTLFKAVLDSGNSIPSTNVGISFEGLKRKLGEAANERRTELTDPAQQFTSLLPTDLAPRMQVEHVAQAAASHAFSAAPGLRDRRSTPSVITYS